MPRRNKRKVQPNTHVPLIFDDGFKVECHGCAFAGVAFKCLTSDDKCLKIKYREEVDSDDNRQANRTG